VSAFDEDELLEEKIALVTETITVITITTTTTTRIRDIIRLVL
jgi:hypothetical protein